MARQGYVTLRRLQRLGSRIIFGKSAKGFNANFYVNHYEDLQGFSYWQAVGHYVKHGKSEGRFPNERSYLEYAASASSPLRNNFDPIAYKFYNKDLRHRFETDEELFRHYVRHGHKEGRVCRFSGDDAPEVALPDEEKWKTIFLVPDFLAWCGSELETIPSSREEALEIFCSKGIERLWPISFEYAFDVEFVRQNSLMPGCEHESDAELYRSWLVKGFPAGIAPNEELSLATYLAGMPFPLSFDWKGFARRSRLSPALTRDKVLVALFDKSSQSIIKNLDLLGSDAAWLLERIGRRAFLEGDPRKAIDVLKQSVALLPAAETFCLLGEAYIARGSATKALEAYRAAMDSGSAPLRAFIQTTRIHASRKDFPEAFATLRRAFPHWRQKEEFSRELHDVIELYFDHRSASAHALYRQSVKDGCDTVVRREADDLLIDTLNHVRDIYLEMDDLPAPAEGRLDGYVSILANDDLRQCTHYRIEQKALQFENAGISVKIFSHSDIEGFVGSLIGAKAAIFYRVAAVPQVLRAILHANSMNIDTYYEIDDLIFDSSCYPDPYSSFEGQISATEYAGLYFGVPLFRYAMTMCKAAIASTPALAERMQALTTSNASVVIRNGLDKRNDIAIRIGADPILREGGRVRLFYGSGTKAHNADFNRLVAPTLIRLMKDHPQVDLVIVGHLKLRPELSAMSERVIIHPFISDLSTYWSLLASCDINLAVLEPGIVADCKSEIKWLEAAVLQIPSVVSATRTYREIVENGVDAYIADSEIAWYEALYQLITQPHLRRQIGARARARALKHYRLEESAQLLRSLFGAGSRASDGPQSAGLRVLVCNVFFAPQSYGGATRVVEDNVWRFVERYPDLEIGVFCSDEGARTAGRLTIGSENGVPVYRLSTPQEGEMDWRAFNEDHAAPFERVLDHFQPDLIHFHCIQRLTATIVEVALQRGIPYVVTLHDAWWISDNQFLADKDGFVQHVGTDILLDCARSRQPTRSIERRQRLASLLRSSEANLSVSAPFEKIYSGAGVTKLRVIENGTPTIERGIRSPRRDGRLALGHVGGRSPHKGASLIEAALRRGRFKNLHLTMMDGTLAPGQMVETMWGGTPVSLIGPCPQSEMGRIYSQLDVLLAPSTWPESFGLVTREALSCGLWVVASDLGAIGQEIRDGHNGNVIDVTTTEGLNAVLSQMDANPQRYRIELPHFDKNIRSMADQASELHDLYHEVIGSDGGEPFNIFK